MNGKLNCIHGSRENLHPELIELAHKIERILGREIEINSGFRCEMCNHLAGGSASSSHLTGKALDISCTLSHDRYLLIKALYEAGVKRYEVGSTWIHIDIDQAKAQEVTWLP